MEPLQITLGERVIALEVRRHQRARRISLKLSPARDGIVMTLPRRASVEAGMKFFISKADWVLANVESDAGIVLKDGAVIPLFGEMTLIRHMPGRGVTQQAAGELHVYGNAEFTARRVKDYIRKGLQEKCVRQAQAIAAQIGKTVRSVRIRDTSARWGSCSTSGNLSFNFRLAFAPTEVLEYLIAHEVAHLAQMNHSAQFWTTVAELCPPMRTARTWIRRNGHTLYRYK